MVLPAHLGLEHPSLLWIGVVGIAAFVAGLGVNIYRSYTSTDSSPVSGPSDEQV